MNKIEQVRAKVRELYGRKDPKRDPAADWLYDNHVLVVAQNAHKLAKKYGASEELSEVAALLHDVADAVMARANPSHEAESLTIARRVMAEAGFTAEEIALVVDDAIAYHSCRGDERPKTKEGLVLATADALAHFQTDFYVFAARSLLAGRSLEDFKAWTLQKIDRDLNSKIAFDEEREAVRADYNIIKKLFSR